MNTRILLAMAAFALGAGGLDPAHGAAAREGELKLWYGRPAAKWLEALPIGNGRVGAMFFGGIEKERFQFNEESLWTGRPAIMAPTNSPAQWDEAQLRFEQFNTELYQRIYTDLTPDDQQAIGRLKARYTKVQLRHQLNKMLDGVEDGLEQLKGAVEEGFN